MTYKEQVFEQKVKHAAWLKERAYGAREKRISCAKILKRKSCLLTDALLKRYLLSEVSYINQYNLIMGELKQQ